jgi:hypothetical protein
MVTITIPTLSAIKLADLDNGSMVLMSPEGYIHSYDDMGQLADDLLEFAESQTTDGWEGDESGEWQWTDKLNALDIISAEGSLSGRGGAYMSLVRSLVSKMHNDWIC